MSEDNHNLGGLAEQPPSPQAATDQQSHLDEASPTAEAQESPKLSPRKLEVLNLLVHGQANKEIAAALGISVKTVEFHLKNIYTKLGVTNRAQAIAKAIQLGSGKNQGFP